MKTISLRQAVLEDLLECAPLLGRARAGGMLASGPAQTGHVGERIVFIAGIETLWPGVGEAWNVPGPAFREYLEAPRSIRHLLEEYGKGYRRIQTTIIDEVSRRFDAWLGFEEEARLKDFGPNGEDGIIMRLRSW